MSSKSGRSIKPDWAPLPNSRVDIAKVVGDSARTDAVTDRAFATLRLVAEAIAHATDTDWMATSYLRDAPTHRTGRALDITPRQWGKAFQAQKSFDYSPFFNYANWPFMALARPSLLERIQQRVSPRIRGDEGIVIGIEEDHIHLSILRNPDAAGRVRLLRYLASHQPYRAIAARKALAADFKRSPAMAPFNWGPPRPRTGVSPVRVFQAQKAVLAQRAPVGVGEPISRLFDLWRASYAMVGYVGALITPDELNDLPSGQAPRLLPEASSLPLLPPEVSRSSPGGRQASNTVVSPADVVGTAAMDLSSRLGLSDRLVSLLGVGASALTELLVPDVLDDVVAVVHLLSAGMAFFSADSGGRK